MSATLGEQQQQVLDILIGNITKRGEATPSAFMFEITLILRSQNITMSHIKQVQVANEMCRRLAELGFVDNDGDGYYSKSVVVE